MEQTFGSFLREKRMARGLTLRGMAAKLDLSPVYMSNIENDRRAAPSQEYLERMALLLQLDKPEREWMLDLAAKSKQNRVAFSHPPEVGQRAVHPKLSAVAHFIQLRDPDTALIRRDVFGHDVHSDLVKIEVCADPRGRGDPRCAQHIKDHGSCQFPRRHVLRQAFQQLGLHAAQGNNRAAGLSQRSHGLCFYRYEMRPIAKLLEYLDFMRMIC